MPVSKQAALRHWLPVRRLVRRPAIRPVRGIVRLVEGAFSRGRVRWECPCVMRLVGAIRMAWRGIGVVLMERMSWCSASPFPIARLVRRFACSSLVSSDWRG